MPTISNFPNANLLVTDDERQHPDVPMLYEEGDTDGYAITAYKFSFKERLKLLFFGGIAIHELTYHESLTKKQISVCDLNKPIEKVSFIV